MSEQQQGFWNAFLTSFSLVAVSEIGDKTFFITSFMSVRNPRIIVFVASLIAVTIINVFSIFLGVLTSTIPPVLIHYISICLFLIFGIKMLIEGYGMSGNEEFEDLKQVKMMVDQTEQQQLEIETKKPKSLWQKSSWTFLQVFWLIFLAEWGDKSQLSVLLLAAKEKVLAVGLGAFCGYFLCSAIAVLGSRTMAQMVSAKTMSLLGGLIFILSAITKFWF